jgi:hypothetical protein
MRFKMLGGVIVAGLYGLLLAFRNHDDAIGVPGKRGDVASC